jgi:hypothetical protein
VLLITGIIALRSTQAGASDLTNRTEMRRAA